ncbi:hypothetical protein Syun_011037 [Stephania yunnanensis]|uniref:ENT domain-containing protein n=1 Tax=Stephania yunnanensis TaxID=152371 RepID=A0AAP0PF17_9MAGN
MRFKKGNKIEVFKQVEVASGSWICAEILSGNGHNYDITYAHRHGVAVVERIPRKFIRPCQPVVKNAKDWAVGDMVEVLDDISWKVATVLKVIGGSYYMVRFLGSYLELKVHKSDLRARQIWKDDQWFMAEKDLGKCEDAIFDKSTTLRSYQNSNYQMLVGDGYMKLHGDDNDSAQESYMLSSRKLKRVASDELSYIEPQMGAARKVRAVEVGRHRQVVPGKASLIQKVDAVASPHNMLGEKHMHASFCNQTGLSEMDTERAKQNRNVRSFDARRLECNDANSASVVDSCSITSNSVCRSNHYLSASPSHEFDSHSSDAESSCCPGHNSRAVLPRTEDYATVMHKMELHAYHCTINALYASGPLSWEKETLVTNLRFALHISNDEHLMEVRNLVSSAANRVAR